MPTTDKHSPDSAFRALRRIGVFEDPKSAAPFLLPERGPGIKGWGDIDYLKGRAVRFARHRRLAKRGGEPNRSRKGWERFLVSPGDGSILARGDTLMGSMCQECHSATAAQDYVFTR